MIKGNNFKKCPCGKKPTVKDVKKAKKYFDIERPKRKIIKRLLGKKRV